MHVVLKSTSWKVISKIKVYMLQIFFCLHKLYWGIDVIIVVLSVFEYHGLSDNNFL